jgi:hypothetical protein
MNDSKIIDDLGGTSAVAAMFEPPIKPPSVSEWRKKGIPDSRRQTLKLLRPDVFGPTPTTHHCCNPDR